MPKASRTLAVATAIMAAFGCSDKTPAGNAPNVDLSVDVTTSQADPFAGNSFTLTLTVRNNGPREATNVLAGDSLAAGLTYVSHVTPTGTYTPANRTWRVGTLGVDQEVTMSLVVTAAVGTDGDTLRLYGGVRSETFNDSVSANNVDSVFVVPRLSTDPSGPGLLFASNWSTATGTGVTATGDGGRWTDHYCELAQRSQVMSVVPGAPHGWTATPNILQLTMVGTNCALIQNQRDIPPGMDYYVRMYIRVDNANVNTTNHPYKTSWRGSNGIILWSLQNRNPTAGTYRPTIRLANTKWIDPNINQGFDVQFYGPTLNYDEWYRFEAKIEYVGNPSLGRSRVIPRIYNMAGVMIADANNYVHTREAQPFTATTLQKSLNDGAYYQHETIDGYLLGHIHWPAMGYEGPAGNVASTERYFYAAFEARSDRYPGPVIP